jgi:hypothetical protein
VHHMVSGKKLAAALVLHGMQLGAHCACKASRVDVQLHSLQQQWWLPLHVIVAVHLFAISIICEGSPVGRGKSV